jgi:type I restriction enzyme M protein
VEDAADRIRDHNEKERHTGGISNRVNQTFSSPDFPELRGTARTCLRVYEDRIPRSPLHRDACARLGGRCSGRKVTGRECAMKATDLAKVRATLWEAADEFRANSKLTSVQYRNPVLGLVFLAYAESHFDAFKAEVEAGHSPRNPVTPADYRAKSVLYVPDESRLSYLVDLPESEDLGKAIDEAMKAIEGVNPELRDILPRGYSRLERSTLIELLRLFAPLPSQLGGDAFGLIYEDFLNNFAAQEGKGGGEYFTPESIVRLIVEILEPFEGRVLDPACGSGGMFVQSAKFVERHNGSAVRKLTIFGVEQKDDTVPLAKMNLALHGLSGDIRQANSYYEDPHAAIDAFDFVMANPPFNVDKIKKEQLAGDHRFPFGMPKADNGNYLWIQEFYAALSPKGRAGFVMANSAGDAGHSEKTIRQQLIKTGAVDVVVAIRPNFLLGYSPGNALVPRQEQDRHAARRHRALHRCTAHLQPDRPRPSRLPPRAVRVACEHCAAVSRRGGRDGRRQ